MNYNFDLLKDSGLRMKGELDKLFGVSRVSLFNYKRGKSVPSRHTVHRVNKVFEVLSHLVAAGKLPLKEEIATDEDRRKAAFAKLEAHIQRQLVN